MEHKGRTIIVPACNPTENTLLRVDLTYGLQPTSFFRNGMQDIEDRRTPKDMLYQQIIQKIPGVGHPHIGHYDIQTSIGQLFDAEHARAELKKIVEKIIGFDTWYSTEYRDDTLSVHFTQDISDQSTGLTIQPGRTANAKLKPTPFGEDVIKAIREITDKGISVYRNYVYFRAAEPELPDLIGNAERHLMPLLGSSGHTVKWLDTPHCVGNQPT